MEVTRTVVADTVVLRVSGMHSHRDVGALLADVEHVLQGGDRHIVLNRQWDGPRVPVPTDVPV